MITGILTGGFLCIIVVYVSMTKADASTLEELESRIVGLEQALKKAEEERKKLEKILESAAMLKLELEKAKQERTRLAQDRKELEEVVAAVEIPKKDEKATVVSLYGRFWPKVTYRDGKNSSTDLTDALSRVGIDARSNVNGDLTAFMRGEWDTDLEQNGDWGDARLGYIGLEHATYGYLAIGKQWDAHYNIVAEGSDVFYNRRSPYGFNEEGAFRSNNQIRYANRFGPIKLDAMLQVNGEGCSGPGRLTPGQDGECAGSGERIFEGGGRTVSTDPDHVDAVSIGLAYDGPFYLGVSYLRQNAPKGAASSGPDRVAYNPNKNPNQLGGGDVRRDFIGVGGRWQATDALYLGFTYQYLRHYDASATVMPRQNRYTLDLLGIYDFGGGWKTIFDVFLHDRDSSNSGPLDNGPSLMGQAVVLVKELNPAMDVFVEWVRDDFGNPTLVDSVNDWTDTGVVNKYSLGFRYDFDVKID